MKDKLKVIWEISVGILGLIHLTEMVQGMAAEKKQKVVYEKGTTKITEF